MNCVVSLVALLLALAGSADGHSSAASPSSGTSYYRDFPLWKDVPGRTFAKLGEGVLPHGNRWAAYVSRCDERKRGGEDPCLTVARITAHGGYNVTHAFGPLAPVQSDAPPVIATWLERGFEGEPGETMFAMSFKPSVASVKITASTGETLRRRTHLLNMKQRRKVHLPAMRYVAVGLQRAFCITEVDGYSSNGDVAFEGPTKRMWGC